MAASVLVVAHYLAKPGKEDEVRGLLNALVAPSRREIGCYQYDLLRNQDDPHDFCFVERWEDDQAVDQHSATACEDRRGAGRGAREGASRRSALRNSLTRRYEPVVGLSLLKGRLPVGRALLPLGDLRGGHCFCHLVPSRRVELPKCFRRCRSCLES